MPTENRSSNTEMVSVPREWLNSVALLQMPLDQLQEQAVEFLCEPCDEPAEQHQGEPVAHALAEKVREALDRQACPNAWMVIAYEAVVQNYTHADPGEVERLRYKAELYDEVWELAIGLGFMNVTTAISKLRTQLAERDALLERAYRVAPPDLGRDIRAALSASAEPSAPCPAGSDCCIDGHSLWCPNHPNKASAPVERDERAEFESWCAVIGYTLKTSESGNGFKPGYGSELFSAWQARAALERNPS
ncbi:hypothetical protein [Pseudomonas putida]|uniref:Phage protein n=1 Tax=Pseudomonas putida TaxID=303 RepID=A0A6S5TNK2_PSEPU|nr:hypothetical protein [Pseudomonas putida]BBT41057.1 hypothetical protein WP8W18C01_33980 [Pseudomonas putida]